MRLNDEIERQTASIAKKTEAVLRRQAETLASPGSAAMASKIVSESPDVDGAVRPLSDANPPKASRPASSRASAAIRAGSTTVHPGSGRGSAPRTARTPAAPAAADVEIDAGDDPALAAALAGEMGEEATVRFLKAKVRVMQQEAQNAAAQLKGHRAREAELAAELKRATGDGTRHTRAFQSVQTQAEKAKVEAGQLRSKLQAAEQQNKAMQKDLDEAIRQQKKTATKTSSLEVRLTRALEEADKLRQGLKAAKASSGDTSAELRGQVEELKSENKKLVGQKEELLAAFRKQMQLIDVLKRQKLHIEAARVLQFSEDEFVKALEWGVPK